MSLDMFTTLRRYCSLIDWDRGKNKDVLSARVDRLAPPGSKSRLDYKLKHIVPQLLHVGLVEYNDAQPMAVLPYAQHVTYLTSDILGTGLLYDHLQSQLTPVETTYHTKLIAPLTPLLVAMTESGVRLDPAFIRSETAVLTELMENLSLEHEKLYGCALGLLDDHGYISWLFGTLGLVARERKKRTKAQVRLGIPHGSPSLKDAHLKLLANVYVSNLHVVGSLKLIRSYRKLLWLLNNISSFLAHLDYRDGRVHTSLRDTLATGRIASTGPNLQGIPKSKVVAGLTIRPRNVLIASDGFELVTFDVAQADIRVMAHAVGLFGSTGAAHLAKLRADRYSLLEPFIGPHYDQLKAHRNPRFRFKLLGGTGEPSFNPMDIDGLGAILTGSSDLYRTVAAQVTGLSHIDDPLRNVFKTVVLSMANSITPVGLAPRLGYSGPEGVLKAKNQMDAFWSTYPKVRAYLDLMEWQVALTGQTFTWAGRPRACSAHHWMVTLPRVELLISYKGDSWYWLEVIPLRPSRLVLTCWIRKVWDATFKSSNYGKLIYEDVRGPLTTRPYRLFQPHQLLYVLPVRNLAWRSIRKVRTDSEEATYYGFDSYI